MSARVCEHAAEENDFLCVFFRVVNYNRASNLFESLA